MKRIIIGWALFILLMIALGFGISTFAADDQTVMYKYCTENYENIDECIRAELYPAEEGQILTIPQMVVIANDVSAMGEVEADTGVFNEIYTNSEVISKTTIYPILFLNTTKLADETTHKNYVIVTNSKGQIVGRLNLEGRIVDLEGYANNEMNCLTNTIDFKTYKDCMTKTTIKT